MHSVILIDKKSNAAGLQRYLETNSPSLAGIRILEKTDLAAMSGWFADIRCLFGTWHMPVLSEKDIAEHFPALELVIYAAGDTSYFAAPFTNRGVEVLSALEENAIPVAEFVLAQILLANKGYFQARDTYRRGFWRLAFMRARTPVTRRLGNFGATVGIIGLGAIGTRVVGLLEPFDLKVLVHDPYVADEKFDRLGVRRASLEEIFATSDVISNHLPDTAETVGMLDYRLFSSMKPDATFINTGRGRQVDERGLVKAMREVRSRTALLDVTRREPPDPFSPLFRTPNILLSPHIAGSLGGEIERLYRAALRQYEEHFQHARAT